MPSYGVAGITASTDIPVNRELTTSQLQFSGAVEFGSRALGIHNANSDYDFAMLRTNFNKLMENTTTIYTEVPIKNYFKVIPRTGNATIVRGLEINNRKLDLILVDNEEHLATINNAIYELKLHSYSVFISKTLRIKMFEELLIKYGFKKQLKYRLTEWILRTF